MQDKQHRIEERDGMCIEWDVPITMDDGLVLRADVYRPLGGGQHPVLMTHGRCPGQLRLRWCRA